MPDLRIEIELVLPDSSVADAALLEAIRLLTTSAVQNLRATLGLPGNPLVDCFVRQDSPPAWSAAAIDDPITGADILRLSIEGERCRYPDTIILSTYSYVINEPLRAHISMASVQNWWASQWKAESWQVLAEFIARIVLEIAKHHAGRLLTLQQVSEYLGDNLSDPRETASPVSLAGLHEAFADVLKQWISLVDTKTVFRILHDYAKAESSPAQLAEELISALRTDVVEIVLPPDSLRQMATADQDFHRGCFHDLRQRVYEDTGVWIERFRFAIDDRLNANCFALKLNHVVTTPYVGLATDLRTLSSDSNSPASMAGLLPTLRQLLRRHSAKLIDLHRTVDTLLSRLANYSPALVDAVKARVEGWIITRVLRHLAEEGVSLHDFQSIANACIDYGELRADHRHLVFDDRLRLSHAMTQNSGDPSLTLLAYVRTRLKRYFSSIQLSSDRSNEILLLDIDLERRLIQKAKSLDDQTASAAAATRFIEMDEHESILRTIRATLFDPETQQIKGVLLTDVLIRRLLRQLLVDELPDITMLAYQELVAETKVIVRSHIPREAVNGYG
jgi:flagellar biosynthesis component FlhA